MTAGARGKLLAALPIALFALVALTQFGAMQNHDVAWYLVAASRMAAGGSYLADFFEMNLPLAIGLYVPPAVVAEWLGWTPATVTRLWVLALAAQSLALVAWIQTRARLLDDLTPVTRAFAASWLVAGLLVVPAYHFGQREHLIVILATPWLCLLGTRDAAAVPSALRHYVVVLAAVGFFVKPHYAPLPFLLLLLKAWHDPGWRPQLAVAATTTFAVGLLYAAWVVLFQREWFEVAAWAFDLYGAHGGHFLAYFLNAQGVLVLGALALLGVVLTQEEFRRRGWPLVVAAAWAICAYGAQNRGWAYHLLPTACWGFLATGLAVLCHLQRPARRFGWVLHASALGLAAALAVTSVRDYLGTPRAGALLQTQAAALLRGAPGGTAYVLSYDLDPAFPLVAALGLQWGSRYSGMWPLPMLLHAQLWDSPELAAVHERYWDAYLVALANDLERYQPGRVLLDVPEFQEYERDVDVLEVLTRHPRFAQAWSRYRLVHVDVRYRLYERDPG